MKYLLIVLLLASCASRGPSSVNRTGEKAHKRSQQAIERTYGRNYHAPNRFRRRHF